MGSSSYDAELVLISEVLILFSFQVKKKQFFKNFTTILLFGIVGTVISFCLISLGKTCNLLKFNGRVWFPHNFSPSAEARHKEEFVEIVSLMELWLVYLLTVGVFGNILQVPIYFSIDSVSQLWPLKTS